MPPVAVRFVLPWSYVILGAGAVPQDASQLFDGNHSQAIRGQGYAQFPVFQLLHLRLPGHGRLAQLLQLRLGGIRGRTHLFVNRAWVAMLGIRPGNMSSTRTAEILD